MQVGDFRSLGFYAQECSFAYRLKAFGLQHVRAKVLKSAASGVNSRCLQPVIQLGISLESGVFCSNM